MGFFFLIGARPGAKHVTGKHLCEMRVQCGFVGMTERQEGGAPGCSRPDPLSDPNQPRVLSRAAGVFLFRLALLRAASVPLKTAEPVWGEDPGRWCAAVDMCAVPGQVPLHKFVRLRPEVSRG